MTADHECSAGSVGNLPLPAFLYQTIARRYATASAFDSTAVIPSTARNLLDTQLNHAPLKLL